MLSIIKNYKLKKAQRENAEWIQFCKDNGIDNFKEQKPELLMDLIPSKDFRLLPSKYIKDMNTIDNLSINRVSIFNKAINQKSKLSFLQRKNIINDCKDLNININLLLKLFKEKLELFNQER